MTVAKVIVDVAAKPINQAFDYKIPAKFEKVLQCGMRVIVPFGVRKVMGFVVDKSDTSDFEKLKEIVDVLDITPALTKELLQLGNWLADKTVSLYIQTYQAMLPQVLKTAYKKELIRNTEERLDDILESLFAGRDVIPYEELEGSTVSYRQIQKAVQEGAIIVNYIVSSRITKKYKTMIYPNKQQHELEELYDDFSNAKKQQQLLRYFIEHYDGITQHALLQQTKATFSPLKALIDKRILKKVKEEAYRNPFDDDSIQRTTALQLTDEQEVAIRPIKHAIQHDDHDVFLIHGVTGSGKTEIYLQAINDVIQKGKEAIVLVPEISLTPQMVRRFKGRFGSNVAVLHSALSAGEKYDEWRKIQRKEVQVVVGARSAIFAPFENLGIIIMDEEHETTYKQEEQPRYHARDVAIERGENHDCPVLLGSATPSLESYARAQKGVYKLSTLMKRTNDKGMPDVEVVDMRDELHAGNRTMFSRRLKESIQQCIERGEQVVLLLNRRGYSTFVMCRDCGHVKECPHCDIALTYHKHSHQLKCHYCSYEERVPTVCPECNSDLIRFFGTGTQRVEEALSQSIPESTIIRMDVDTTRRKGAHERLLNHFASGKADILLGTQMIAKGLDFENVTLVGVLTADSMLHLPDFRSSEKTFQLMTQVSGRAGRHELPGNVIVQAYTPDHYSIQLASQYDYVSFFKKEMQTRKAFQYPPYVFLVLITVSHPNKVKTVQTAQHIVKLLLAQLGKDSAVLGPSPSPIARMKDRYRYQCMIKYKNDSYIHTKVKAIMDYFAEEVRKNDLYIAVDMEPQHLT
ncbi:MAG TPA: primosomal protein N' [Virgibacillus sp.]|nr:primosomal protein N' [Virgibacillus sp.]